MTNTIQDEEDNANIDDDASMEEDSEVSDEGDDEDVTPTPAQHERAARAFRMWESL